MLNVCCLIGRLTKSPELRKTPNGVSVASFTIAVNGRSEKADFINCIAWRQSAEYLTKYANKGYLISVSGSLSTRTYEKDGVKQYITEVVDHEVSILLSPRGKEEETTQGATKEQSEKGIEQSYQDANFEINPEDLPFY